MGWETCFFFGFFVLVVFVVVFVVYDIVFVDFVIIVRYFSLLLSLLSLFLSFLLSFVDGAMFDKLVFSFFVDFCRCVVNIINVDIIIGLVVNYD